MTSGESPGQAATRLVLEGWEHLKLQRPLAAWASFHRAIGLDPASKAAARAVETLEKAADLPAAARALYRFRSSPAAAPPDLADLDQAADYYGREAARNPAEAGLWYNRALCLAWTGANREAVSCLERTVELEAAANPESAADAWLLAEVLRQGAGAEPLADDLQYSWTLPWSDDQTAGLLAAFPEIEPGPRPTPEELDRERPDFAVYLWFTPGPIPGVREVLANIFAGRRLLRLASPRLDHLEEAVERLAIRFEVDQDQVRREARPLPFAFLDAAVWTFRVSEEFQDQAQSLERDRVEHYFEDQWIHVPRRGLAGLSPLKATLGDAALRAKLAAVVRFREQLAQRPAAVAMYQGYPFDRLRRRLGLEPVDPAAVDADDLACAPPAALDALDPAALDLPRLREAVASAAGLRDDARAARLAALLLDRAAQTPEAQRPRGLDPTTYIAPLIRDALRRDAVGRALGVIKQARGLVRPADLTTLDDWAAEIPEKK